MRGRIGGAKHPSTDSFQHFPRHSLGSFSSTQQPASNHPRPKLSHPRKRNYTHYLAVRSTPDITQSDPDLHGAHPSPIGVPCFSPARRTGASSRAGTLNTKLALDIAFLLDQHTPCLRHRHPTRLRRRELLSRRQVLRHQLCPLTLQQRRPYHLHRRSTSSQISINSSSVFSRHLRSLLQHLRLPSCPQTARSRSST